MGDLDDERAMFLALAMTPGIGSQRLATLLKACDTALGAHSAPLAFLGGLPGFSRAAASAVREARLEEGLRLLRQAEELGAHCVLRTDPDYPALLCNIAEPPPILFMAGHRELLERPAVAIVGSRDHSGYGADVCRTLATQAAKAGIVVISGMARGLDAVAHTAALDSGGSTIGVLGNGLGVVYPAANRHLYERVWADGLLITEFPPGERPSVHTFPRRNRLISALARVTVVVEAAAGSGALITAEAALEQGREVMAVPGNITSHTSVGTNRLLRDGAAPVLEAVDVLEQYPELAGRAGEAGMAGEAGRREGGTTNRPTVQPSLLLEDDPTLLPEERRLLQALASAPMTLDDLVAQTDLPVPQALAALFSLELAGRVEQGAGLVFRAVTGSR